jgi:hypothetical protein
VRGHGGARAWLVYARRMPLLLRRLAGLGLLLVGLFFVTVGAWYRWFGIAPEAELRFVTGPATDVRVEVTRSARQEGELLSFGVAERRFTYARGQQGYHQLLAAVQAGESITVGYGPTGLPFGLRARAVDLYTISIAHQPLRRYGDKLADERSGSTSAMVFGSALLALAFFLLRRPRAGGRPAKLPPS